MKMIDDILAKLDAKLQDDNFLTQSLKFAEEKSGIQKSRICLLCIAGVTLYLVFGPGAGILCNLIGFAYPAYCSIKAIESVEKDDDTKWLTYWVVYATFTVIECFTDILLFWVPFYSLLKCVFLLFCMAPIRSNGSLLLYDGLIKPYFLKHEKTLDEAAETARSLGDDIIKGAKENATKVMNAGGVASLVAPLAQVQQPDQTENAAPQQLADQPEQQVTQRAGAAGGAVGEAAGGAVGEAAGGAVGEAASAQ